MIHLVQQAGLGDEIFVDSAGTSGYHDGDPADRRMRRAAENRGYSLDSRSRMVTRRDLKEFDLVLAMDRSNYAELNRLAEGPADNVKLLSEYLEGDWPEDVPDPYYGEDDGFDYVLDMLEAACPAVLAYAQGSDS